MIHELTAFLLDRKLYNEYSHYDLRFLIQPSPITHTVHTLINELHNTPHTPGGNEVRQISCDELRLLAQEKLSPKYHAELAEFLKVVQLVRPNAFSPESIHKLFRAAYQKNLAAYLTTCSIPVLNGAESLDVAGILTTLEEGSTKLYGTRDTVDYDTYTEQPPEATRTIPTYISSLDEAIDGGLSPGQLGTYVGWPGIGKTLLLHQSAGFAYYYGYHASLITLEIGKSDVCRRLDMLFNRKNQEEYLKIIGKAKERNGRLTILDATNDVFTPASVRSFLESQRRSSQPVDILFIDYADLMETGRSLEDYNELGEIYRQLRRLANRFEIPIWTASQAIRSAFNKQWLGLGDIADSFKKARIADLIVTINQTEEEQEAGNVRLYVAKSRRNKGHPKLHLRADMERMCLLSNGRTQAISE